MGEVLEQFRWNRDINLSLSSSIKKTKLPKRVFRSEISRRTLSIFGFNLIDHTQSLPDEILLEIFSYLPKACLLNISLVCRRWKRISTDGILWRGVDMSEKIVLFSDIIRILDYGVSALKMVGTRVRCNGITNNKWRCQLQLLDVTMSSISTNALLRLLSRCRHLEKLSLESWIVNNDICREIAENKYLKVLNMSMCSGVNVALFSYLQSLEELNVSWMKMDREGLVCLISSLPSTLKRLNISRHEPSLNNGDVINICTNCPNLVELNISSNVEVTGLSINAIADGLTKIESLSVNGCFSIPVHSLFDLRFVKSLKQLNLHRTLKEDRMEELCLSLEGIQLNKSHISTVARSSVEGGEECGFWGFELDSWS